MIATKPATELALEEARVGWKGKEAAFFARAKKYFGSHPWPPGEYTAMGSVWRINPRNIPELSFTIPLTGKRNRNAVIAHEMLHFLEYDYLEKKGHAPSEPGDDDNTFWQFTENLNALIEQEDEWDEFTGGVKKEHVKPECRKMYEEMKKLWTGDSVDELAEEILGKRRDEFIDDPATRFEY